MLPSEINTISLNEFLPFIMANCPELPESIAQAYLRQTCIDFCQRSSILRRHVTIDLQEGVSNYPIWPNGNEQVVRINQVSSGGKNLRGQRNHYSLPSCGTFTVQDGFVILSSPVNYDADDALHIEMTVTPSRKACEIDELLYQDWQEAIEDGTLARLFLLPNYPFSDPRLAMVRSRSYADHIIRARVRASRSNQTDAVFAVATPFLGC